MSESENDPVSGAFDALVVALKDTAYSPNADLDIFQRVGGYLTALKPLVQNWKAGKPASGKETGKRGRKPGSKNASSASASAGGGGSVDEYESEVALTDTQIESDAPALGRSRRFNA